MGVELARVYPELDACENADADDRGGHRGDESAAYPLSKQQKATERNEHRGEIAEKTRVRDRSEVDRPGVSGNVGREDRAGKDQEPSIGPAERQSRKFRTSPTSTSALDRHPRDERRDRQESPIEGGRRRAEL